MSVLTGQNLVGVWTLEAFIVHRESGEAFVWPGRQSGTLIYTGNGYVSVAQNREPLPDPTPEDRARESNFYTGTYALDLEHGRVVHTPLQSSVPSTIGIPAEREVRLESDGRLRLSGVGLKERVTLVWRKV
jgi:hypothetical protein